MSAPLSDDLLQKIDSSLELGINFLYEHQYPNGEFCCYYAPDEKMKEWCVPDSAVFPASLIAACLLELRDSPKVEHILSSVVNFLSYQVMRGGLWNYYTKWNPIFKYCPPDTDDTVFSSHVLRSLGVAFQDNSSVVMHNRNSKGLFYTWIVLRPVWDTNLQYWKTMARELKRPLKSILFWFKHEGSRNDIDAVVNANILFYFGLNDQTRPVINYLVDIIRNNKEDDCDKWYRNPFTVYYFISRNYKSVKELSHARDLIIERIGHNFNEDGSFGISALDTALAISTMINFDYRDEKMDRAVYFLLHAQTNSGCWERNIFFYTGGKIMGWGSEEIVTGYCLEALAAYRKLLIEN